MKSLNDGIRAVSFRLRREVINQQAREQPANRRYYRDQPKSMRAYGLLENIALHGKAGSMIARDPVEKKAIADMQGPHEELSRERADDS